MMRQIVIGVFLAVACSACAMLPERPKPRCLMTEDTAKRVAHHLVWGFNEKARERTGHAGAVLTLEDEPGVVHVLRLYCR